MEEADGRIISHARDMILNGAEDILIRSCDSDVVVLAVLFYFNLKQLGLQKLWVLYGTGKAQRYIPAHTIANALADRAVALRGFHAFTGCDTTSSFIGKGKRSCFKTWTVFPEATQAFKNISEPCSSVSNVTIETLERFVILLYAKDSKLCSTDELRRELFTSGGKKLEALPPTSQALQQHTLRSAYQAANIWGQSELFNFVIQSPKGKLANYVNLLLIFQNTYIYF